MATRQESAGPSKGAVVAPNPLIVALELSEYDVASAGDMTRQLEATYTASNVIVDMSGVRYIDSTCLGRLVKMRKEREGRGFRPARIVISSAELRRLFKLVKFDTVWPIFDSLDAAIKDEAATNKATTDGKAFKD
jgi:anti-anti-sigma factor